MAVEEINIGHNLAMGSESRKQAYLNTLYGTPSLAISFHLQSAPANLEAARLALTTVLRRKGRILDAVADTQQQLRQSLSPELAPLFKDYTNAQTQLANYLYGGYRAQDVARYPAQIDALRRRIEQLENDLARRSAEFRVTTAPIEIDTRATWPAPPPVPSTGWSWPRFARCWARPPTCCSPPMASST